MKVEEYKRLLSILCSSLASNYRSQGVTFVAPVNRKGRMLINIHCKGEKRYITLPPDTHITQEDIDRITNLVEELCLENK